MRPLFVFIVYARGNAHRGWLPGVTVTYLNYPDRLSASDGITFQGGFPMTNNDPYREVTVSDVASPRQTASLARIVLPAICLIGLFGGAALAQQPTAAQQNAIKSACRSDFMAQCSGVQPGGQAALSCLQQHSSALSSGCQQALSALGSSKSAPAATTTAPTAAAPAATAPAAAPSFTPREEMAIAREECGPDFRTLCRTVALGAGRGIACLRQNMSRLSPGCQKVLSAGR